jgi:hypothetical protein
MSAWVQKQREGAELQMGGTLQTELSGGARRKTKRRTAVLSSCVFLVVAEARKRWCKAPNFSQAREARRRRCKEPRSTCYIKEVEGGSARGAVQIFANGRQ